MPNHEEFFNLHGLEAILRLSNSKLIHIKMYVLELMGVLAADPTNIPSLEKQAHTIVTMLKKLLDTEDFDLRHSASSLIVNLVATSMVINKQFQKEEGLKMLAKFFLDAATPDGLRPILCKAISALAQLGIEVR